MIENNAPTFKLTISVFANIRWIKILHNIPCSIPANKYPTPHTKIVTDFRIYLIIIHSQNVFNNNAKYTVHLEITASGKYSEMVLKHNKHAGKNCAIKKVRSRTFQWYH